MSVATRLFGFAALLAVVFAGAALAGGALDVRADADGDDRAAAETDGGHGAGASGGHGAAAPDPVRGLAVADRGLRLVVEDPELRRGRTERLRFAIVDDAGAVVRDFDVAHEKRMHLIVARRDLAGFRHLHPEQDGDGAWSVPITLDQAGSYRVFADFSRDGEPQTLAADLRVDGAADLRSLPVPSSLARSDGGYDVRLDAEHATAGAEAELRFTVTRDGEAVETEPYLGAGGHLVALREGDLAFLHVHPTEAVDFAATFPTEGRYRLFLQFKHRGQVRTAAFTQAVAR